MVIAIVSFGQTHTIAAPPTKVPDTNYIKILFNTFDTLNVIWKRVRPNGTLEPFTPSETNPFLMTMLFVRFHPTNPGNVPNTASIHLRIYPFFSMTLNTMRASDGDVYCGYLSQYEINPGILMTTKPTIEFTSIPIYNATYNIPLPDPTVGNEIPGDYVISIYGFILK